MDKDLNKAQLGHPPIFPKKQKNKTMITPVFQTFWIALQSIAASPTPQKMQSPRHIHHNLKPGHKISPVSTQTCFCSPYTSPAEATQTESATVNGGCNTCP